VVGSGTVLLNTFRNLRGGTYTVCQILSSFFTCIKGDHTLTDHSYARTQPRTHNHARTHTHSHTLTYTHTCQETSQHTTPQVPLTCAARHRSTRTPGECTTRTRADHTTAALLLKPAGIHRGIGVQMEGLDF
jgi:transcription initiation factor IIF auxiliary subunit